MGCVHSSEIVEDKIHGLRPTELADISPEEPQLLPAPLVCPVTTTGEIDWNECLNILPKSRSIPERNVIVVRPLSTSAYTTTSFGNCDGQPVILKSLNRSKSTDQIAMAGRALISEISMLIHLQHPHIVEFVGYYYNESTRLTCILEYMQNKTLRVLLDSPSAASRLTWANKKILYAIDVCKALVYMHRLSPKLIHRTIKAENVLLTQDCNIAKLSGFGTSRFRTYEETMTQGVGNAEWSAPELLVDSDYSEKIDVYSFGVLLVELDTCAYPLAEEAKKLQPNEMNKRLIVGSIKPSPSKICPCAIKQIIAACLQFDPALRPSSTKVLKSLYQAKQILMA